MGILFLPLIFILSSANCQGGLFAGLFSDHQDAVRPPVRQLNPVHVPPPQLGPVHIPPPQFGAVNQPPLHISAPKFQPPNQRNDFGSGFHIQTFHASPSHYARHSVPVPQPQRSFQQHPSIIGPLTATGPIQTTGLLHQPNILQETGNLHATRPILASRPEQYEPLLSARPLPLHAFGPPHATGQLHGGQIFEAPSAGNIVEQSKITAESAKTLFRYLGNFTLVPELFDHVFKTSGCLKDVEGAIQLLDESNELIAKDGPEIIYLEALIENIMHEKNVTKLIRASAKMLRILEDLIPKLALKSKTVCITSLSDSVEDFKSLAHLLVDVLNHRAINLPEEQRQLVKISAKIMSDVARFLVSLNRALNTFDTLCDNKKTKSIAVYNTIGDIMESLSDLFEVLGFEQKSNDIMKQGKFLKKIVDAFRGIDELSTPLDCGDTGAFGNLALTLDDVAEIVQSVGVQALGTELGIDLSFINEI